MTALKPTQEVYDLVVIGGGPAGLTAATSGATEGLATLVVERSSTWGGQAAASSRIENYPGFPWGVTGAELATATSQQARRLGAELISGAEVEFLGRKDDLVRLFASTWEVSAKSVLIATGVAYRTMAVPGADGLTGKGLYYGSPLIDVERCKQSTVMVVGGGNSAGQAALYLAEFAAKVVLVARKPLRDTMSDYLIKRIVASGKIEQRVPEEVTACHGSDKLQGVTLGSGAECSCNALYAYIGASPQTHWCERSGVQCDAGGYILTGMADATPHETTMHGVYAAGDVRSGIVRRVATAVGDAASAVAELWHVAASGQGRAA